MQFDTQGSRGILAGRITVSFRNWKRPHAAVGGVYHLRPSGAVKVTGVLTVRLCDIEAGDLRRSGFDSVAEVAGFLKLPESASVTRVEFELTDEPAAKALTELSADEVVTRLQATDRRSAAPWTAGVLRLIRAHPATRAGDLAPRMGWETPVFKANVRKLKRLGLTQSLETGYSLTDLGEQVAALMNDGRTPA
ncbi:MAG: hypothetical protein OXC31_22165 [Spirochaetaceae bacterium]|nr:hypothetical protein [Spirochaetaceae bacterium]